MLYDFLKTCSCSLEDEVYDWRAVLNKFNRSTDNFVAVLPVVIDDLWPVFVLESTAARRYRKHNGESVYFVLIRERSPMGVPYFAKIIRDFYENDTISEKSNYYNAQLNEMILLHSSVMSDVSFSDDLASINLVYISLSFPNTPPIHLFLMVSSPESFWENIIQGFEIETDFIVDSNKGFGDWFENSKLYEMISYKKQPHLLPPYYFKGKFISHNAPDGYQFVYRVPESGIHDCDSEIYKTNY